MVLMIKNSNKNGIIPVDDSIPLLGPNPWGSLVSMPKYMESGLRILMAIMSCERRDQISEPIASNDAEFDASTEADIAFWCEIPRPIMHFDGRGLSPSSESESASI